MNKKDIDTLKKAIGRYARVKNIEYVLGNNQAFVYKLTIVTRQKNEMSDCKDVITVTLNDNGEIYYVKGRFDIEFLEILNAILKDIMEDKK